MLYQNYETEVSLDNLKEITNILQQPQCLLGGWAVYLTVNNKFKKSHGRNYHGSRDIDLGFHISKIFDDESIKNSLFIKTIKVLEENGFLLISQRYAKCYHTETKQPLNSEKSKKTPLVFLFYHYIDPIVDYLHPLLKNICGFIALDEPLLREVFENKKYKIKKFSGFNFILPNPEILLGCKINSVVDRSKEDKKIKDIVDIYSLIWYSGIKLNVLKRRLSKIIDSNKINSVLLSFEEEDYEKAANAINIRKEELSVVISNFVNIKISK